MTDGWTYPRRYQPEHKRPEAPATWLHHDNRHRPHTAYANQPPFVQLIKASGRSS